MRVLIIEDEKPAARRLQRMLEQLDLEISRVVHSVKEAIEYLSSATEPDLIFLDIQLSDGLSFEIFEHVQINSAIIFTTAYDEYALQAFKLNSIDYLLKPIDAVELEQAVNKFKIRFRESEKSNSVSTQLQPIDLQQIAKLLGTHHENYKTRFTVKVGEHIKLFTADEIQLFYSENKGTYINLANGRNYLIDGKLESVEADLDPKQFFRISRQVIVRIDAITDIISYTNSRLRVKIDSFKELDLIVSRERVKDFKAWLEG
ncbi:LytR/AlgR family response regulator transcription factor [Nonlabens marinus]|uniref:Two-component system response regulator n=1 Tax=Nonlabens marinus S1-08 TaxID=1454201 RepID=W8VS79_9FLAO|nr:LytTR family DNA-binding domain-containing protein [Nonlabens marinus]BAO56070.1 two-component system response regulator [Nonlabens marinus S1-08]